VMPRQGRVTSDMGGRVGSQHPTTVNPISFSHTNWTQHPYVPASLASVADNRTLNTWRNELQAHLPLTTHKTSSNKAFTGIGTSLEEAVLHGLQEAMETPKEVYYVI
jgi:hypothetical protein